MHYANYVEPWTTKYVTSSHHWMDGGSIFGELIMVKKIGKLHGAQQERVRFPRKVKVCFGQFWEQLEADKHVPPSSDRKRSLFQHISLQSSQLEIASYLISDERNLYYNLRATGRSRQLVVHKFKRTRNSYLVRILFGTFDIIMFGLKS